MRRNKFTYLFIKGIILACIGMALNPLDSHAYELDFKDGELTSVQDTTAISEISEETTEEAEEQGSSTLIIWLIIVLLIVVLLLSSYICFRKGVFNRLSKKNSKIRESSNDGYYDSNQEGQSNNIEGNLNSSPSNKEIDPLDSLEAVLNRLLPTDIECTTNEKEVLIAQKLSTADKAIEAQEGLEILRNALNLSSGTPVNLMVEEIKSFGHRRHEESLPSLEQRKEIREEVCRKIIDHIGSKNNKTLSSVVYKASENKSNSIDSSYETLIKFINILPTEINPRGLSTDGANMSFDQLMNKDENRRKMMHWALSKISDFGYMGLATNGRIDDTFEKIANLLLLASSERPEPNEIVDKAVIDDQLTDEQKIVLLRRLIDKINLHINNPSAKLDSKASISDFVVKVAEKVQTPSSHEEAENIVRTNNLNAVNELLESNITDFDKKSLASAFRSVIVKLLNKQLKGFDAVSYEDAMSKLTLAVSNSNAADNVLKQFDASALSELPQAIREKQATELFKSVDNKVNELLPDKHIDSIPRLVNALIRLAEEAKVSKELIADELEKKISMRNSEYVASDEKDVIELINNYDAIVIAKEQELTSEISNKEGQIKDLEASLVKEKEENTSLSDKNKVLMSATKTLVDSLHTGADCILDNYKTILNPCSDNDESQCVDIEDRLFEELNKTVGIFKSFNIGEDVKPIDARTRIQKLLVEELSKDNNPINTVCRYYAYSRLPFMTDTSREYGITFNRKNMSELFNSIESLYVQFGINLNIPDLFVVGFEEGIFENLTGQTYGDLDNLCQNSRNHFDNIDSNAKPSNVIVDIVNVGFTVDGKVGRTTSVLTY